MKTVLTIVLCATIILALVWIGSGPKLLPEMQECLQSHGSKDQYAAVLKKYCNPEIIHQAIGLLVVKDPQVVRTMHSGKTVCYLVEGSISDAATETAGETIQNYSVCWENGRVVSLDFAGGTSRSFGG